MSEAESRVASRESRLLRSRSEAIAGATRAGTGPSAPPACDATIQANVARANEAAPATEARSQPHQSHAPAHPATTTADKTTALRRSENAVPRRTDVTSSRLRNGPRGILLRIQNAR